MKKQTKQKIMGAAGVVLAASAGLVGGFALDNPEPYVVEKVVTEVQTVEVPGPTMTVTEIKEVPVEVEKEVIVEVPVNGTMDVVEFLVDQNGDLRELDISEIEDRGLDELISQVSFIRESKLQAAYFVDKELADELDRRRVSGVTLDEDDIERVRIDDDLDELLIDDVDFDDMDADVTVTGTFEHDDIEYEFEVLVEIKDGEVDEMEIVSVSEA